MDPKQLRGVLNAASFIQKTDNGYLPYRNSPLPVLEERFQDEDLYALDPRLVPVFHELTEKVGPDDIKTFSAQVVRLATRFWEQPDMFIIDHRCQGFGTDEIGLRGLHQISLSRDAQHVSLSLDVYDLDKTPCGVRYPTKALIRQYWVEKKLFDQQFPGWETRYTIADSLDLTPAEKVAAVFQYPEPIQAVDISTVTFE